MPGAPATQLRSSIGRRLRCAPGEGGAARRLQGAQRQLARLTPRALLSCLASSCQDRRDPLPSPACPCPEAPQAGGARVSAAPTRARATPAAAARVLSCAHLLLLLVLLVLLLVIRHLRVARHRLRQRWLHRLELGKDVRPAAGVGLHPLLRAARGGAWRAARTRARVSSAAAPPPRVPASTGQRLCAGSWRLAARASGKSSGDPSVSVSGPARVPAREDSRTRRGARRMSCTEAKRLLVLAPRLLSQRAGGRAAAVGRAHCARGASVSIARVSADGASLFGLWLRLAAFCAPRARHGASRAAMRRSRIPQARFSLRVACGVERQSHIHPRKRVTAQRQRQRQPWRRGKLALFLARRPSQLWCGHWRALAPPRSSHTRESLSRRRAPAEARQPPGWPQQRLRARRGPAARGAASPPRRGPQQQRRQRKSRGAVRRAQRGAWQQSQG